MTTLEEIRCSADRLTTLRPAYREVLDFYTRVYIAQEKSRPVISLSSLHMDAQRLTSRREHQLPLAVPSEFQIDLPAAAALFRTICNLSLQWVPHLEKNIRTLIAALDQQQIDLEVLYAAMLTDKERLLEDMASTLALAKAHLVTLAYLSMAPGIVAYSQQLSAYLEPKLQWCQGCCPICGNSPDLAVLEEAGRQQVRCGFCSHTWSVKRLGCLFCDSRDSELQHYLFAEEEPEYRVNFYDCCRGYIKVVDLRQMERPFFPNLERTATWHLDLQARGKGYHNYGWTISV